MPKKWYVGLVNELSSFLIASTGIVFFITGLYLGIMSSKGYIYVFDSLCQNNHGKHIEHAIMYC